jgi:hypothetical protein
MQFMIARPVVLLSQFQSAPPQTTSSVAVRFSFSSTFSLVVALNSPNDCPEIPHLAMQQLR